MLYFRKEDIFWTIVKHDSHSQTVHLSARLLTTILQHSSFIVDQRYLTNYQQIF